MVVYLIYESWRLEKRRRRSPRRIWKRARQCRGGGKGEQAKRKEKPREEQRGKWKGGGWSTAATSTPWEGEEGEQEEENAAEGVAVRGELEGS